MIYIITPRYPDFKECAIENKISFSNINGCVFSHDVKWINEAYQLLGIIIYPKDKIIKGKFFHIFSPEEAHRITVEIALMKYKYQKQKEIDRKC